MISIDKSFRYIEIEEDIGIVQCICAMLQILAEIQWRNGVGVVDIFRDSICINPLKAASCKAARAAFMHHASPSINSVTY